MFVAKLVDEEKQDVTLLVADPRKKEYKFKEIQIPLKDILDHRYYFPNSSYTILDTSEGQVFLNINHYGDESKHGIIYTSDSTGIRFSTSLLHNTRSEDG